RRRPSACSAGAHKCLSTRASPGRRGGTRTGSASRSPRPVNASLPQRSRSEPARLGGVGPMNRSDMSVVILCGGQGTRAYPYTKQMPKALMEVGEAPIVEQVMRIYSHIGYRNFVLSVGYLKDQMIDYFARR